MAYPKEFARHFIGVGAVVIHEHKILLIKQNYGRSRGFFMIPGGFVDPGETLLEGVKREVFEETGMKIEGERLLSVRTMVRNKDKLTDLYSIILCKLVSEPEPLQPQDTEIEEARWIGLEECLNNPDVSEYTKIIIKKTMGSMGKGLMLGRPISDERKSKFDMEKYEEFWV